MKKITLVCCLAFTHTQTHINTQRASTFWSVMYENFFLHDSMQHPTHTAYLWLCFVYLPPHRCSPFISCSGIPVKASPWLVSWTMMDTGGQRKCPHGWDQSTVLGLWQWPWRLIISPQKCSFMLLILCKLVSLAFLLKQPHPKPCFFFHYRNYVCHSFLD